MRVVNRDRDPYTVYIGRPGPFGNPFLMGQDAAGVWWTRTQVLDLYETWARQDPFTLQLIRALPEDAVLGCWCAPKPCHGDIIIKLWNEMHS